MASLMLQGEFNFAGDKWRCSGWINYFYLFFVLQGEFNFAGDWAPMCPSPWKPVVDTWADEPILPKDPR